MSATETQLTLGTAGHVDHGKTALVEALTGTNTDRLEEERRRGISIALGYARLELPNGASMSIVDVPGHERLVRTMVAGVTGVDLFLLAVAADDGVMQQTREHLTVLRALGIERGVVAVTKADLVDDEALELVGAEVGALVTTAPVIGVSARTGQGLTELRDALAETATSLTRPTRAAGPAVLHVDRSFTLRGIGTVVTGTLWSGALRAGERVEILPAGIEARVRSVQVHNQDVAAAAAGTRVALNLGGVARDEVSAGDVIASPASGLRPSYRLDVELHAAAGSSSTAGTRVQVHHGTRSAPARHVDLGEGFAQLRLHSPVVARSGDRVVLRSIAPPDTVGGATVLDPNPPRHGAGPATERLRAIREVGLEAVEAAERGQAERPPEPDAPPAAAHELEREALLVLAVIDSDGAEPRAPTAVAERLGLDPRNARRRLDELVAAGRAVRLAPAVYYSRRRLEPLCECAIDLARASGELTLAGLRDELGTSRKYARAILDHLDAEGVTVRRGDRRTLRRVRAP